MRSASRIAQLVEDLEPVRPVWPARRVASIWLLASWAWGLGVIAAVGPYRSGFLEQLTSQPRFALEVALGVVVSQFAVIACLRLAVPGFTNANRLMFPAIFVTAFWVAVQLYGWLVEPALPPSMVGKREFCFYETFAYSIFPIGLALYLMRRRFALEPARAALLAGLAGTTIPATVMYVACMADPWHILTHHFQPIAWMALATAAVGPWILRRR